MFVCVCHSYWFLKLSSGQIAAQPTKILIHMGTNINCCCHIDYVSIGASSRLFHILNDMAVKEGKDILPTKTMMDKKVE